MYCLTCGARLVVKSSVLDHYDIDTGKKIMIVKWTCPKREKLKWCKKFFHYISNNEGSGFEYYRITYTPQGVKSDT